MSDFAGERRAVVDAFAGLSADIAHAPSPQDAQRLRSVTASALLAQLRTNPAIEALPAALSRLSQVVPESARADLLSELVALEAAGVQAQDARVVLRRDARETLLSGRPIDSLTGLAPGERLGPFATLGGIDIWFDVFFATQRMEVRQTGASAPTLVFTQARLPVIRRATTTIDFRDLHLRRWHGDRGGSRRQGRSLGRAVQFRALHRRDDIHSVTLDGRARVRREPRPIRRHSDRP